MHHISSSEQVTSWIPVNVAGVQLQVSRQRIYQLIENGSLVGRKIGTTWLISQRSVAARLALLAREEADDRANRRRLGHTGG